MKFSESYFKAGIGKTLMINVLKDILHKKQTLIKANAPEELTKELNQLS